MNIHKAIAKICGQKPVSVTSEPITGDNGLSSRISSDAAGVRRYTVVFPDGHKECFAGKRKSVQIIVNGIRMVSSSDPLLALMLVFHHRIFGYSRSSLREAALYGTHGLLPEAHIPRIIGSVSSRLTGRCFLAMELLPERELVRPACTALLDLLADMHATYFGKADSIRALNRYSPADYRHTRRILHRMFERLSDENEQVFGKELTESIHRFISQIDTEYRAVSDRSTLTHNDCCDRNICISGSRIVIYDWELACCQNPEHDVIELLISVMAEMTDAEVMQALAHYRQRITELTGVSLTDAEYHTVLRFNTLEFCVNKLCLLRLAGKKLNVDMPRDLAVQTARMMRLLQIQ